MEVIKDYRVLLFFMSSIAIWQYLPIFLIDTSYLTLPSGEILKTEIREVV